MPRYKLTIEYDGGPYAGWQKQPDRPSIQEEIEKAVFQFCGERAEVMGAGRTDAGVHAVAQVAHVDISKDAEPFSVMQGINFYLFNQPLEAKLQNRIAIIQAEKVSDEFHARFSATKRHYFYRIINRRARLGIEAGRAWHVIDPLNERQMHKAAQLLLGKHDFSTFRDTQCQAKSPEKTLDKLDVVRVGDEVRIFASARSFLHHQVRIMVGSLALVGKGRWTLQDMQKALDARHRTKGGPTAPPDGLYLTGVEY
jgi:tRNA pseudouridine38-40 synthase